MFYSLPFREVYFTHGAGGFKNFEQKVRIFEKLNEKKIERKEQR